MACFADINVLQGSVATHARNGGIAYNHTHTHTHTHQFYCPFPGLPGSVCTRKAKPIWILLKQETVSGSGISWAICKSATRSRQTTTPTPTTQFFYRLDALPAISVKALKERISSLLQIYQRIFQ